MSKIFISLPISIVMILNLFLTNLKPSIEIEDSSGDEKYLEDVILKADVFSNSIYKNQRAVIENQNINIEEKTKYISYDYYEDILKQKLNKEDYDLIDNIIKNKKIQNHESISTNSDDEYNFVNFISRYKDDFNLEVVRKNKSNNEVKNYTVNLDINDVEWITNMSSNYYNDKLHILIDVNMKNEDKLAGNKLMAFEIDLKNNKSKKVFEENLNTKEESNDLDKKINEQKQSSYYNRNILVSNLYSEDKIYFIVYDSDSEGRYELLEYDIKDKSINYIDLLDLVDEEQKVDFSKLEQYGVYYEGVNNNEANIIGFEVKNKEIDFVVLDIDISDKSVEIKKANVKTNNLINLTDVFMLNNKLYVTVAENNFNEYQPDGAYRFTKGNFFTKVYVIDLENNQDLYEGKIKSDYDMYYNILENKESD